MDCLPRSCGGETERGAVGPYRKQNKKKNAHKNQAAAPAIFTHYVGWMSENKQGGVIFER